MPTPRFPMSSSVTRSRLPKPLATPSRIRAGLLILLLALAMAGLPALARPVRAQDAAPAGAAVPMFRGDPMHTGAHPGPAPEGSPVLKWAFATDDAVRSSPAVVDGTVYVGSKDFSVYAIDAATGAERWRFTTGGPVISSPAVMDGTVFVGSQDGYFYALDAASGERRWYAHLWTTGSPTVADGLVYVSTTGNTLHVLDATNGLERWHAAFSFGVTDPAVAGQSVYVVADGMIQAFDRITGRLRWIFDVKGLGEASPVIALGRVYAYVSDELEPEVRIDEEQDTNDDEDIAASADENRDAGGGGAAARAGQVYSIDAESGDLRWTYAVPSDSEEQSAMALVDGALYIGSNRGWLYSIDPLTGQQHWGYQTGGAVIASPVVAGGVVVIGSYAGGVHTLDAKTGIVRWIHDTGAPVWSSAAIVDGVVYVGSDSGSLLAIAGSGPPAESA